MVKLFLTPRHKNTIKRAQMKITQRQLRRIIRETDDKAKRVGGGQSWGEEDTDTLDEDDESTIKYNADPALKGDQTKLPDSLQKGIIDKAKKKSSNESKMKITKRQLGKIIREEIELILSPQEPADEEVGMAINQLQAIAATALELGDLIKSMNYVPEWGDGKIAVALDDLSSIRSYLIGKQIGR